MNNKSGMFEDNGKNTKSLSLPSSGKKSLCCSPLSLGANDENKFLPWRTKNKSSSPVTDLNLKSSRPWLVKNNGPGLSIKSK